MSERYQSFNEFWPYYLAEHAKALTRALHMTGTVVGSVLFIGAFVSRAFWLLPLSLLVSYGVAWMSHFTIEKNRPATFSYPLWSFFGDWKMLSLALRGRLGEELQRSAGRHSVQAARS